MKSYTIEILEFAYEDIELSKSFYEQQADNLGQYFTSSILTDVRSLSLYGGIHQKYYGFYRMLAKRFPYAIYYDVKDDLVIIYAILDLRTDPISNRKKLSDRV